MNVVLFATALLMTAVALGFATTPLIVSYRRQNSGSAKLSALAVAVVFALGIVLYGVIGKPQFSSVGPSPAASDASTPMASTPAQNSKVGSITSLLAGLEAKLAENPEDGKGWLLLAKSYDHLGRSAEAKEAYDKAAALGITDAALEARLTGNAPAPAASSAPAAPAASGAEIHGRVSVADAIADNVEAGDIVYVVAKSEGNPMPLAVLRRSATELPFDFVLSDANSMVQGAGISEAAAVIVSARLTKAGDALNMPAKFGASSGAIDPHAAADLALVIDLVPGS